MMEHPDKHARGGPGRLILWLFEVALWAFPKEFRNQHQDGMRAALRERHCQETATLPHRLRSLVLTLIDTATAGLAERMVLIRDRVRTRNRGAVMRSWLDELRVITRSLAKSPGFTAQAVLTIALGTVCLGAAYPLLSQVVLRPLPYHQPERLVTIRTSLDQDLLGVTAPELMLLARQADLFDGVAGVLPSQYDRSVVWTEDLPRERLHAIRATPNIMDVLGVTLLGPGYDRSNSAGEQVVLSHRFWQTRFGGDTSVVGRVISLNDVPHTVTGVLPEDFEYPLTLEPYDLWVAFPLDPAMAAANDNRVFRPVARLRSHVTIETVFARVPDLLEEFHVREATGIEIRTVVVRSLHEDLLGSVRLQLVLSASAAAVVLLIACLNLGLLASARNLARHRELAVRRALGASRSRIARLLLTEVAVVTVIGVALGGAVSVGVMSGIVTGSGLRIVRHESGPGTMTVVWTLIGITIVPLLVTLIPVLRAGSSSALSSRRVTFSRRVRTAANGIIVFESALVFGLLVAAGLTLVSLEALTRVDPGFEPVGAMTMEVQLPPGRYEGNEPAGFFQTAEEHLTAIPGVRYAGSVTHLPLDERNWGGSFAIQDRTDPPPDALPGVDWEFASPGYFAAAGIPILEGRGFTVNDTPETPLVAVINETLARRYWPRGGAIGARVNGNGFDGTWFTVVGVVGDVKQQGLEKTSRGYMYMASLQSVFWTERQFVLRTASQDPLAVTSDVRRALLELEPAITIGSVNTLEDVVHRASGPFRLRAMIFGVFGLVAGLLGMAGIHGVVSHAVETRRRETGIRLAVGADATGIFARTLVEGLRPVIAGILCGVVLVLVAARWLGTLVYGIEPISPALMTSMSGVLAVTAIAATLPPALRARRLDPIRVLQDE